MLAQASSLPKVLNLSPVAAMADGSDTELEHDDDGGRGGGVANTDVNYDAWHKQEHRAEPAQSDGREEQGQASTESRLMDLPRTPTSPAMTITVGDGVADTRADTIPDGPWTPTLERTPGSPPSWAQHWHRLPPPATEPPTMPPKRVYALNRGFRCTYCSRVMPYRWRRRHIRSRHICPWAY
jgi:hypothetical protein